MLDQPTFLRPQINNCTVGRRSHIPARSLFQTHNRGQYQCAKTGIPSSLGLKTAQHCKFPSILSVSGFLLRTVVRPASGVGNIVEPTARRIITLRPDWRPVSGSGRGPCALALGVHAWSSPTCCRPGRGGSEGRGTGKDVVGACVRILVRLGHINLEKRLYSCLLS